MGFNLALDGLVDQVGLINCNRSNWSNLDSYLKIVPSVSGNLRFLPKSFCKNMFLYHSCLLLSKNINLFTNIEESFCKLINFFPVMRTETKGAFVCYFFIHAEMISSKVFSLVRLYKNFVQKNFGLKMFLEPIKFLVWKFWALIKIGSGKKFWVPKKFSNKIKIGG